MSKQKNGSGGATQEPDRLDLHADGTGRGTTATVTARRGGPAAAPLCSAPRPPLAQPQAVYSTAMVYFSQLRIFLRCAAAPRPSIAMHIHLSPI